MRRVLRLISALLLVAPVARAEPPTTLFYEGALHQAGGAPVDDTVRVTPRIHDAPTEGSVLWPDVPAPVDVDVVDGRFTLELGPLDPALFDDPSPRYLSVTIGEGDDAVELEPRQLVGGAAFALVASSSLMCAQAESLAPAAVAPLASAIADEGVFLRADGSASLHGPWDLDNQPLSGVRLAGRAGAPEAAASGQLWFDSASGRLHVHDGERWARLWTELDPAPAASLESVSGGLLTRRFQATRSLDGEGPVLTDVPVEVEFVFPETGDVVAVWVELELQHPFGEDLDVELVAPGALDPLVLAQANNEFEAPLLLGPDDALPGGATLADLAGTALEGPWVLRVTDTAINGNENQGRILSASVTIAYESDVGLGVVLDGEARRIGGDRNAEFAGRLDRLEATQAVLSRRVLAQLDASYASLKTAAGVTLELGETSGFQTDLFVEDGGLNRTVDGDRTLATHCCARRPVRNLPGQHDSYSVEDLDAQQIRWGAYGVRTEATEEPTFSFARARTERVRVEWSSIRREAFDARPIGRVSIFASVAPGQFVGTLYARAFDTNERIWISSTGRQIRAGSNEVHTFDMPPVVSDQVTFMVHSPRDTADVTTQSLMVYDGVPQESYVQLEPVPLRGARTVTVRPYFGGGEGAAISVEYAVGVGEPFTVVDVPFGTASPLPEDAEEVVIRFVLEPSPDGASPYLFGYALLLL